MFVAEKRDILKMSKQHDKSKQHDAYIDAYLIQVYQLKILYFSQYVSGYQWQSRIYIW